MTSEGQTDASYTEREHETSVPEDEESDEEVKNVLEESTPSLPSALRSSEKKSDRRIIIADSDDDPSVETGEDHEPVAVTTLTENEPCQQNGGTESNKDSQCHVIGNLSKRHPTHAANEEVVAPKRSRSY
ncbi:hypothetical protein TELCIR_04974 [Teladorsagia circumcincta]|uniref:Uncharacterized protein n=1 Tax=Teladorsagia circumcincta TaxID=45464 RepID=A0A2G9UTJ0_TELCI|nr:hypothetical protein TELCIR_04974 [Teladorsagia circumcincta]